ncbi:hypothetical protein [Clavibacter tessellarius]|uniref:hypothetical protein n=1 Tax=Clavibacter tessellarius TaxID=31965 RepID=UPI0032445CC7
MPEEQALIEGGPLSGALPDDNAEQTSIGLFFNDIGSGSKMSYYLRSASRIQAETCADTTTYTVDVDMTSIAPLDAATSLPATSRASTASPRAASSTTCSSTAPSAPPSPGGRPRPTSPPRRRAAPTWGAA